MAKGCIVNRLALCFFKNHQLKDKTATYTDNTASSGHFD